MTIEYKEISKFDLIKQIEVLDRDNKMLMGLGEQLRTERDSLKQENEKLKALVEKKYYEGDTPYIIDMFHKLDKKRIDDLQQKMGNIKDHLKAKRKSYENNVEIEMPYEPKINWKLIGLIDDILSKLEENL